MTGRVADAVALTLRALGVREVFGVIGSGNFAVTNALVAAGAGFHAARHETAAVTMADAWARVTGEVGVATVHQGPGLTNAVTGLSEAAKSRTPLLVLAADTGAGAERSNFAVDQAGLAAAIGAAHVRLASPATAVAAITSAHRLARDERRSVLVSMPLDVQAAALDAPEPPTSGPALHPPAPSVAAIDAVVDALAAAERPVVIAGRGARISGAGPVLRRLGERTGALLATSAVAHGLFVGDPWALGISGGFASPTAAELITGSDLVLAVGASLTMWTTRHGRLVGPDATVVQVDREVGAIGSQHRVDLAVVGDAAATAEALLAALDRRGHRAAGWRTDDTAARLATGSWRDEPYDDASDERTIDPRTLSIALDEILPDERAVVVDSGHFMGWPPMYWRVPDDDGFVFTQAFQSIGLGLATAIGAAVARPDRLTVAALGDGVALMAASELETVPRLGLDLCVVVYDDAAYGAEVHHFGPHGDDLTNVVFGETDFAATARALGYDAVTVRSSDDLGAVAEVIAARRRPVLVDAKVTPTVVAEWLEEAFRGH
ncbi:MAG: thiamine pyrophosphate-binding protein [Actinomycetota bacterium]|nr:thiamine pyrophosphate-binding protein [Actinomycetota bacterium]